jgi:hypothetical protein
LRQLPPATSKAPFIVIPSVVEKFDFRVLRQNRRVVQEGARACELEEFHGVLNDVAWGVPSARVRKFIADAYVRGIQCGCAERSELDDSTAVFTKRWQVLV